MAPWILLPSLALTAEAAPPAAVIERCGQHLVHFHANDTTLGGPGTGSIDFASIAAALERIGYDRWVSVEVFDYRPDGPTIARRSLEFLRSIWA